MNEYKYEGSVQCLNWSDVQEEYPVGEDGELFQQMH